MNNNNEEHFIFEYNNEEEAEVAQVAALFENEAALRKHRDMMSEKQSKPSLEECIECGNEIPEARRKVVPGVELCVDCANLHEKFN